MTDDPFLKAYSRRQVLGGAVKTVAVGGGVGALLAACGSNKSNAAGPKGSLSAGLFAEPDSLDPATMRLIPSYQVTTAIYDQLLWTFSGSDGFTPGLATSYEIGDGGRSYTFHLRSGVKFHDGTSFDAAAVKATFDRIMNPKTKSISAKGVLGPYTGSTVLGPTTVRVDFSSPNGGFLNNVASPLLAIVSPTAATKYGANFAHHPVGSGPFKFSSWTAGQSITLEKNPDYAWGPARDGLAGPASLSTVTFRIISSSPAQANALQTGSLQLAQGLDIPDVVRLDKGGFVRTIVRASGMPFGFMLNVRKAPTDELAVRKAVQYATDASAINKTVFSDVYPPANTVLTAATFGYSSTKSYAYDPERAMSLLQGAGWAKGSGGARKKGGTSLELQWLLSTGFGFQDAAQLMASQLQAVGFKSSIQQQASPEVFANIEKGIMNVSSIYDYAADPYILGTLFGCSQVGTGPNYAHFCSPPIDSSIAAANSEPRASTRSAAYQSVERRLMAQAMFVPIYDLSAVFVTSKAVKGLTYTNLAIPMLAGVSA
jgi:peptide/nickel transport system substrate-binding protein